MLSIAIPPMPSDFWTSVERISWWVAIIGFPVAIAGVFLSFWQLILVRREQRRIADQLSRGPDLRVGFEVPIRAAFVTPADNEVVEITVAAPVLVDSLDVPTPVQSDNPILVDIKIVTFNAGELGAHNLLWNYVLLQIGVDVVTAGTKWIARRDPEGPLRLITQSDYLHPEVAEPHSMRIRIAHGITKVFIHYSVRSDEMRSKRGLLTVRLQ